MKKSVIIICKLFIIILIALYNIITINEKKKLNSINLNKPIKEKDNKKCFLSPENSNLKIIHIIITRFMIEFYKRIVFAKTIYTKEYIENGIRVMKKYLIPSLEHQICRDFIWMLTIGEKANITFLKSLLNFTRPFNFVILYKKDMRKFIRNITKNVDVLITSRIDYDDRIYYDAVNDVRKNVNISKPIFLYGYDRGFVYYEDLDIYTKFFNKFKNEGAMSTFESLIIVMNKVNDSYIIYDMGNHHSIRKNLLKDYKKFGLQKLEYEPSIFEIDVPKFVWVRQRFSGSLENMTKPKEKAVHFDLDKFYGIKKE